MAVHVYRNSDGTGASDYGKRLDDCCVGVQFGMVHFGFNTVQSRFSVLVEPESFAEVAMAMMKADAPEAIKAFGAAMQAVAIKRQPVLEATRRLSQMDPDDFVIVEQPLSV
jgi:hypothetical protein